VGRRPLSSGRQLTSGPLALFTLFTLLAYLNYAPRNRDRMLFKLFKQSSRRDYQFLRGERKAACRDVVYRTFKSADID